MATGTGSQTRSRNAEQRRNPRATRATSKSCTAEVWHGRAAQAEEKPRECSASSGRAVMGSPLALYLGSRRRRLAHAFRHRLDFDVVDYTNLQRQIIHSTADVGRKKLDSAAEKLKAINPFLNIRKFDTRLSSENALELFREFDIIADGTDNFPTRYLVNDACVLTGKPNVYGSIFRFEGQASIFATKSKVRATAASIPSRHPRGWFHPAPRVECWAFCPDSWA